MPVLLKNNKKCLAIKLRKSGLSYNEIKNELNISKSTLHYWLNKVKISDKQKTILANRQTEGRLKGARKRHTLRIINEQQIINNATNEIDRLSDKEIWYLGIVAYWCEGTKQKERNVSGRVIFTNSDPNLLRLFLYWIVKICKVPEKDLIYTLYIHSSGNIVKSIKYWSKILKIESCRFSKTVIKNNIISNNKQYNKEYYGLIRITVRKSTDLNRKIRGWINGISKSILI